MIWLIAFISAVTTGALGLFGTGLLAAVCTSWFGVSSFEGKSAYMMVMAALLGGVVGFVLGASAPFVLATSERFGGWTSCTVAWGVAITVLLIATACCRLLADVPPRIDGERVIMHIELRLPVGPSASSGTNATTEVATVDVPQDSAPPAELDEQSWIVFRSNLYGLRESSNFAALWKDHARLEDGRWVVPATIWPRTKRGRLRLELTIGGVRQPSIAAPLPRVPGHEHATWSAWMPWCDTGASGATDGLMYRFRLERDALGAPMPTPTEIEARRAAERVAAFESLESRGADTALAELLPFAVDMSDIALRDRAIVAIANRADLPTELAQVTLGDDADRAAEALRTIARLVERNDRTDVDFAPIVAAVGRDLIDRIDRFNVTSVEDDPHFLGAADVSVRFSAWLDAAGALRTRGLGDFAEELGAILDHSRQRPESIAMRQDVCRVASYHFHQWTGTPPHPDDPRPRG